MRLVVELPAAGPALLAATPGPVARDAVLYGRDSAVLYGRDAAAWPVLEFAARQGRGRVRVGLGDVLHLPDGRPARSSGELVARAAELLRACRATGGSR
ncbi:hypothetical protein GPJ59_29430 [Streptomyces bambusae]|uniref:Uncharacterized protein n=2 Tax=Streptomyces bambusae TaxID=1550616 RepID=A0ABS6ZDN2_9ACTN|nr:hypothetical protein [Streptomyces bambusae]